MAKSRYHKKSHKKSKRKSAKRVRAGKKAWRTKVRRYGSKAAAIAASFGRRGKKGRKGKTHQRYGSKHARRVAAGKKAWAAKVRRYGSKAAAIAATFGKHRGHHQARSAFAKMTLQERARFRHERRLAKKRRGRSIRAGMVGQPRPTGFSPELRARLLALRAAREAQSRSALPLPG